MKRITGSFCLLILCILLLQACSGPKPLEYRDLKGIRLRDASMQYATITLDLQFYNPNHYGLRLKNGDINAYLNGTFTGKATLDESVAVPPRDTFTMPVTITAGMSSLFSNALSMLTRRGEPIPVKLEGTIRAGKGGVFVPVKVHYQGMQKLEF